MALVFIGVGVQQHTHGVNYAAYIAVNDSHAPNSPHAARQIRYPMKLQLHSYCTSVYVVSLMLHSMDFHSVSRSIPVSPVANNK